MQNNSKSNCNEKDKDREDQTLEKILEPCKDTYTYELIGGNLNTYTLCHCLFYYTS